MEKFTEISNRENVLIKSDGTVALTDFGIAGDRNKRLTERGLLGGAQRGVWNLRIYASGTDQSS